LKTSTLTLTLILCLTFTSLFAGITTRLNYLNGVVLKGYLQPLVSVIGAEANSGWFHSPPSADFLSYKVEFGIVQTSPFIRHKDEHFKVNGKTNLWIPDLNLANPTVYFPVLIPVSVNAEGPTVFGDQYDDMVRLNNFTYIPDIIVLNIPSQTACFSYYSYTNSNYSYYYFNLLEQKQNLYVGGMKNNLPVNCDLNMYEITVGTFAGTQMTLRDGANYQSVLGDISTVGIGFQHNPAYWIPYHFPVDLSFLIGFQHVEIDHSLSLNARTIGVSASITRGNATNNVCVYSDIAYEQSKMNSKAFYDHQTLSGQNTIKCTLGAECKLNFLNLKFEENISRFDGHSESITLVHNF
jgi:hypothetical protein